VVLADISAEKDVKKMVQDTVREFDTIDILVNNAGFGGMNYFWEMSLHEWDDVLNTNLRGAFLCSKEVVKVMLEKGVSGKIINIASLMSETVREDNAPYAASKGGIRQLTKALAVDWAKYGINVNAIGPGFIQTDLTRALWEDADFDKWVKWKTPWKRWGNPEDIGHAAVFLAAQASDFVTGQIIYVDGGLLSTFGPSSW